MACQRDWYAVLNLARRQVLSESELVRGVFGEKTAREWALHYKLFDIADELAFYVSFWPPHVMLNPYILLYELWTR
jgi:hypothetical protein